MGLLLAHDVDRVSLGNQSFQPGVLHSLGREHVPSHTDRALELLRRHAIRNFNVDLMFAAPGCGQADLAADLQALAARDIPHVSAYCLSFEPGTPLTGRLERGTVTRQLPEEELTQYRMVVEGLRDQGLERYEISNFARPGFESRHNRIYWEGGEYYGVGLGAGSYVDGVRRTNTRDLEEYLAPWRDGRPPHEAERLSARERARERVVLSLRMAEGLPEARLRSEDGFSLDELYDDGALDRLVGAGVLARDAEGIRLTERGFELSDSVFVELV